VFQLGARREAIVTEASRGAADSLAWKALATPSGAFRPVQVVWGQRGYFYLVDAASARLALYDERAALLSTHPLPPEFTPFPAGRSAVFRGADGAFTFVDYGAGEAWQFADRLTFDAATTRWVPRGRVKLPAGLRECVQPAGSAFLYCRDAAGAPLRFDGALNRVALRDAGEAAETGAPASPFASLRPRWDAGAWLFEAARGDEVLFRHRPFEKTWERADAASDSASAL